MIIGEKWLARLDGLSPGWALLGGGVAGLVLATVSVVGIGGWIGVGVCSAVLMVAGVVAWRTEPIWRETQSEDHWASITWSDWLESISTDRSIVLDLDGRLPMVELPGGTFLMGSPADDKDAWRDERPQHQVTVSPFAMACVVVTRGLYREMMSDTPKQWRKDDHDRLPATHVNWFEAVTFCNELSKRGDLTPCYRIEDKTVNWDRGANGYRLPTEAEWEYACRAGTTTRWFFGDESEELHQFAWGGEGFLAIFTGSAHRVGEKQPNPWGLYDMAGNVWEWCWDRWGDYSKDPQTDPDGPPTGSRRVLRGGAFNVGPRRLRSAFRYWDGPGGRDQYGGFRVVRGSRRQP